MGLALHKFLGNVSEALQRPAFKPNAHYAADPVPARSGESMKHIQAFKPGHGAPDPVPSIPADGSNLPSFRTPVTLNEDGSMSWMEVGPVPSTPGSSL